MSMAMTVSPIARFNNGSMIPWDCEAKKPFLISPCFPVQSFLRLVES